ncbi:MAG: c-type cytochrome [Candidatus Promineifilaceae bacterium]
MSLIACQSAEPQTISEQISADAATLEMGATVYAANCANCHGVNLEGQTEWKTPNEDGTWKAPPHDETGHTWHHPDDYILDRIYNGTEGLDASMQSDSNMPAYKDMLTDEEIKAVLDFIKSQWPDDIKAAQSARSQ